MTDRIDTEALRASIKNEAGRPVTLVSAVAFDTHIEMIQSKNKKIRELLDEIERLYELGTSRMALEFAGDVLRRHAEELPELHAARKIEDE